MGSGTQLRVNRTMGCSSFSRGSARALTMSNIALTHTQHSRQAEESAPTQPGSSRPDTHTLTHMHPHKHTAPSSSGDTSVHTPDSHTPFTRQGEEAGKQNIASAPECGESAEPDSFRTDYYRDQLQRTWQKYTAACDMASESGESAELNPPGYNQQNLASTGPVCGKPAEPDPLGMAQSRGQNQLQQILQKHGAETGRPPWLLTLSRGTECRMLGHRLESGWLQ